MKRQPATATPTPAMAAIEPLNDRDTQHKLRLFLSGGAQVVGYVVREQGGGRALLIAGEAQARAVRTRALPRASESQGPPMVSGLWRFTDHLCRECLGRVMQRMDGPEAGLHRCAICGAAAPGAVEDICACGIRLRPDRDLGYRCQVNTNPTFDFPHEVVVARVAPEANEPASQPALPLRSSR